MILGSGTFLAPESLHTPTALWCRRTWIWTATAAFRGKPCHSGHRCHSACYWQLGRLHCQWFLHVYIYIVNYIHWWSIYASPIYTYCCAQGQWWCWTPLMLSILMMGDANDDCFLGMDRLGGGLLLMVTSCGVKCAGVSWGSSFAVLSLRRDSWRSKGWIRWPMNRDAWCDISSCHSEVEWSLWVFAWCVSVNILCIALIWIHFTLLWQTCGRKMTEALRYIEITFAPLPGDYISTFWGTIFGLVLSVNMRGFQSPSSGSWCTPLELWMELVGIVTLAMKWDWFE